MALSHMVAKDEDALICDFAQYYGIRNYRDLALHYAAVLAVGLPDDARVKLSVNDMHYDAQTILLANIVDYLALLVWFQTKDGHKNRNRPKSISAILSGKGEKENTGNYKVFATAEAFEAERQRIIAGDANG